VRTLYEQAAKLAASDVGILITGESGTGKEVLARYVHDASPRADGPFVAVNCAALPNDLLDSELFGVESGAATGVTERSGRFEQSHGGTLFLDEIGDMRSETQAKILRVLEGREIYRLGGTRPRPADVRVLAATNRDVEAMLAEGRFRRDLYHRIADWRAELPPLRRRRADVPNLAAWFLRRACDRRGVASAGISQAALDLLVAHSWPGNIRELEREMGRAALLLDDGQLLESQHLRPEIAERHGASVAGTLAQRVAETERHAIREALAEAADADAAAAALGVSRATLYRRIKKLGLDAG
jgi:transcriptional regulator with PAS, ATPase and Fis domain